MDQEIWEYAKEKNFMIVTKDTDFNKRSVLYGFPPKVIWIRIGNCITERIVELLKANSQIIEIFSEDTENGTLVLK